METTSTKNPLNICNTYYVLCNKANDYGNCSQTACTNIEAIKEFYSSSNNSIIYKKVEDFDECAKYRVAEDNKQTCYKCKHYHATMEDAKSFYHFHNFCSFWNAKIPNRVENADLPFDDVDTEKAYCWGFDKKL